MKVLKLYLGIVLGKQPKYENTKNKHMGTKILADFNIVKMNRNSLTLEDKGSKEKFLSQEISSII